MAEPNTAPASADSVDRDEKFEDAPSTADQSSSRNSQSSDTPPANSAPIETKTETDITHKQEEGDESSQDQAGPDSNRSSKISNTGSASSKTTNEPRSPPRHSRANSATDLNDATPKAAPAKTSRFGAFSASLPSVPWGAAAAARRPSSNNRDPSPQPPAQPTTSTRKTPFGWLSRATSTSTVKSPPLPARTTIENRRNTAASISTLGSNSELMLKALEETQDGKHGDKGPARQSLREKFKALRLQEESSSHIEGVETVEGDGTVDDQSSSAADRKSRDSSLPSPGPLSPSINPDLPPGTVSGFLSAASDATTPIDWDFWQTVVNEGPQAVARTSPEELTTAIAGGIPQTIRGVIWQVLASSKNEDLEAVYHELRVRGTKDEIREESATKASSTTVNGSTRERSNTSSKSSVRSDESTPATSTHMGLASPTPSNDTESVSATKSLALSGEVVPTTKMDTAAIAKLERMIKRDMGSRTSYSKYTAAAGFQDGLFNVCKAYALFDDAVGYPQGMNFVIMPMLFNMSEEEAFCLLVRLMHKYKVREMFVNEMPGLHLHLYQFERLLEDLEPALYCHLNRRGVTPKLYATQWFLTLFAYRLPLQLVMRVFDLVLCEGLEGAILKFGMALVQRNVEVLLAMDDMQVLTTYLKEKLFDVYIDQAPTSKSILESGFFGNSGGTDTDIYRADILVQDACAVKLTPEMLVRYTAEYDDKTKTEKARETELENLKTDTGTKAARIRSLEQRAEKSDSEHIGLANELVKLKVENQDLIDQNESLKGQVEELRKVAASEAANTEERLRASTEQVMQKNIEVQNENRHMEEQMAEMERELVEMKMKFAELNGEHEGLKQKWSDLKKALE